MNELLIFWRATFLLSAIFKDSSKDKKKKSALFLYIFPPVDDYLKVIKS